MTKQEKTARAARLEAIGNGLLAEVVAFNAAVRRGADVRLPAREGSLAGGQSVVSARFSDYDGLWITCANYGGSFCLGNDSRWAEVLQLAGIARDPRTA